jgi:hypothetical protein
MACEVSLLVLQALELALVLVLEQVLVLVLV